MHSLAGCTCPSACCGSPARPVVQAPASAARQWLNKSICHLQGPVGAASPSPAAVQPPHSGASPPPDTVFINRLATEVAAGADVVAAWEQVEALRGQLRSKDAELHGALEALEALQQAGAHGEGGGGGGTSTAAALLPSRPPSAGQQLAQFLKDQLSERDEELAAAHRAVAAAQQQLLARAREQAAAEAQARAAAHRAEQVEAALLHVEGQLAAAERDRVALQEELVATRGECGRVVFCTRLLARQPLNTCACMAFYVNEAHGKLKAHLCSKSALLCLPAAYADQQADAAGLARLELAEVRQAAGARIEQLERELRAAEARLQQGAAGPGATPGAAACSTQHGCSDSLLGWP